jgi:hypothetical protein
VTYEEKELAMVAPSYCLNMGTSRVEKMSERSYKVQKRVVDMASDGFVHK